VDVATLFPAPLLDTAQNILNDGAHATAKKPFSAGPCLAVQLIPLLDVIMHVAAFPVPTAQNKPSVGAQTTDL
jgi:hypothetical protein